MFMIKFTALPLLAYLLDVEADNSKAFEEASSTSNGRQNVILINQLKN